MQWGTGRAWLRLAGCVVLAIAAAGAASAQDTEKELEKYREMINDPMANPGYLNVDRGEALWKEARGAKNVSLEQCDLGEGPGKLEGAYAKLPRYFKDADRVMDLEQRLRWCMENLQGLDTADVIKRRFGRSLRNFLQLYAGVADEWMVFDNSSGHTAQTVAHLTHGQQTIEDTALWRKLQTMARD